MARGSDSLRGRAAPATIAYPGSRASPIRRDLLPVIQAALGDRYTLHREIGRGGAARVFLAEDRAGNRVALKVLHPELQVSVTAERFLREIKFASRIDHPLVARVLDSGEADWLVYYVMPFIEGPTLRTHLDRVRRLPVDDVVRMGRDLLGALGAAHRLGIVHRDVKPENIVLSANGAVLLDFGIARAIEAAGSGGLTRSGITVGTSRYMSPEQVQGASDIDHRTDLYSLGCVLFEACTGQPPFRHPNEVVVLQMHINDAPPDLRAHRPDAPDALAAAIGRALVKERERRWQSADEMARALEERPAEMNR
ncbi:MAG TPA: serine/threonine-protein kinase [Gemmatimonadales bacterium]|nr:serine/threonine-protein kinase [Gemmatimonadales bacterium]